jgi:predicted acylesterase/phospholipase RssA
VIHFRGDIRAPVRGGDRLGSRVLAVRKGPLVNRKLILLVVPLSLLIVACFARTDYLLKTLNKPSDKKDGVEVTPPPTPERIARLTRGPLVDSYLDPVTVAKWMSAMGAAPEVLLAQTNCLTQRAGGDNATCYNDFVANAVQASIWGMPDAPDSLDSNAPPGAEVDAARFLANAMSIAPSLAMLQGALGRPLTEQELRTGIKEGAESAAQYVTARKWRRNLKRPSTAIVMSGGSANGAFSAGAIWRLLGILEQCRGKPAPEGCGDARIDLVAGTSTGTLIGTLVDLFHVQGKERLARELLVSNYTCSVESDLYCVNSTWVWNLGDDVRGLVRFDGIDQKLRGIVSPALINNATELVAVSVDYNSGDVYGVSDQDPEDLPANQSQRADGLIQSIMASIVEPVLAEPVDWVPSKAGQTKGTFVDGGVRSGLPLLQAMQRGAERVLLISTGNLDAEPKPPPEHAFSILMRTLDLFVAQPRVGEVQQAEMAAVSRRYAEFNVCQDRLVGVPNEVVSDFCRRRGPGFEQPEQPRPGEVRPQAQSNMWIGPARFDEVASSWRTSWMYRTEEKLETASGYAFTPVVMRPLFLHGVRNFHRRCPEMLRLFDIRGNIAWNACSEPIESVEKLAEQAFAPIDSCTQDKPEQRKCE